MKGGGRVLHIWWVRFGSVLSVLAVLLGIVVGVEPRAGAKRPKVYVNDQATRLWDEETGEIGEVHADSDTGGQESWRKKSQEIDLRYGEQVIDITQRITEDALSWLTYPTDDASVRQIAEAVTRGKDFIILRSIMGHGRYSPKETNWLDGKLFEFGRKSALLYRREIGAAPDKVFIHYPSAAIPGLMLAEDWNGDGAEVATGGVWHSSAVLKALMIMEDLLGAVLEQEPEALQEPETTLRFKNALMATLEGFHFPPRIEAEARYALARLGFMGVNSKLELDAIRASTPLAERAYNEGRFHFVHPGTDIGRDFYPATVPETDEDRAVYERFKVRAATLDRPNAPFLLLAARPDPVKGMAGLLERVIVARKAGKQIPNIAGIRFLTEHLSLMVKKNLQVCLI